MRESCSFCVNDTEETACLKPCGPGHTERGRRGKCRKNPLKMWKNRPFFHRNVESALVIETKSPPRNGKESGIKGENMENCGEN